MTFQVGDLVIVIRCDNPDYKDVVGHCFEITTPLQLCPIGWKSPLVHEIHSRLGSFWACPYHLLKITPSGKPLSADEPQMVEESV